MRLTIGIDASRIRSGGAVAHLRGVLENLEPEPLGIRQVHLWAYRALLDKIPGRPWLVKHAPQDLEGSLARQLWWQRFLLPAALEETGCDILYTADASTLCRFRPTVVFSQDLVSYDAGVIWNLDSWYERLRAFIIRFVQNAAFQRADGVIFLTRHAARVVQQSCGSLRRVKIIPHGMSDAFRVNYRLSEFPEYPSEQVRCVYVSPILGYKHQWNAVKAIHMLREEGHDLTLTLIGGGAPNAQGRLERQIREVDPDGEFVTFLGHVSPGELPTHLAHSHIFLFLSTCEAFGITLLEGMAVGLPIVCSNRSSLPETLQDGGVYCDPYDPGSIVEAIKSVLRDEKLRCRIQQRAKLLSDSYSWKRCSFETFRFITEICGGFETRGRARDRC